MRLNLIAACGCLVLIAMTSCASIPKQPEFSSLHVSALVPNQRLLTEVLSRRETQLMISQASIFPLEAETTRVVFDIPNFQKRLVPEFEDSLRLMPGIAEIKDDLPTIPLPKEERRSGSFGHNRYHFKAAKISEWKADFDNDQHLVRVYFSMRSETVDFWKETIEPASGRVVGFEHRSFTFGNILPESLHARDLAVDVRTSTDHLLLYFPSALHARSFISAVRQKLS